MNSSVPPPVLVAITIKTKLGETYRFPDMTTREIEQVISEDWGLPDGSLTLANVSKAVLIIPVRIIAEIYVNDEKKWSAP